MGNHRRNFKDPNTSFSHRPPSTSANRKWKRVWKERYSERQWQILTGAAPLEDVMYNELNRIRRTAKAFGDVSGYEIADALYQQKTFVPSEYVEQISLRDSESTEEILERLTPPELYWILE